jgi:hypothetical protein
MDYLDLFQSHKRSGATASISTFKKEFKIDLESSRRTGIWGSSARLSPSLFCYL